MILILSRFSISKLCNYNSRLTVTICNRDVETIRMESKRSNSLFFAEILWFHGLIDPNDDFTKNIPRASFVFLVDETSTPKLRWITELQEQQVQRSHDRREIATFRCEMKSKKGGEAFALIELRAKLLKHIPETFAPNRLFSPTSIPLRTVSLQQRFHPLCKHARSCRSLNASRHRRASSCSKKEFASRTTFRPIHSVDTRTPVGRVIRANQSLIRSTSFGRCMPERRIDPWRTRFNAARRF